MLVRLLLIQFEAFLCSGATPLCCCIFLYFPTTFPHLYLWDNNLQQFKIKFDLIPLFLAEPIAQN
ncbi:hypothetical protein ES319_D01G184800v1 [Gossypium barbadense]|uniref:Uncharacterized protein n=2 Tax=Gossypium TaxID=3633 RepID=A0A5J5SVY5_GOSBA|nr:hypothetical protein ES319_D01G184800v1 [Gossypium barbadense]TYG83822.1 hypothetical protein ES288_D01G198900v1 [Gossypium darwinii]